MDLLADLNVQQQQAVITGSGPVLVLAGPGSGKTKVLTHRIAYLISRMDIHPYQIMAVTFTNKAAREMANRVDTILGPKARGTTMGTFHGICSQILRREAGQPPLPFKQNFVIFDSDDQIHVVRQALADLDIDEKKFRAASVHASISKVKNELILPEDYPVANFRDEVVKKVYFAYQRLLIASNGLDFDDLLLWTVRLMEEAPDIREKYARRYEHVLVDEFQDTNNAQYTLVKHIASFHGNIFAVGDVDQSIYAWRGADYRNVLRFERDYPDAQTILLEQNYRSTQSILDVATAVIERNPHRKPKRLFTARGTGEKITLRETYDDRQEAEFIVNTIAQFVATKKSQPGDFAIMYRTNAQSRLLEEAFLRANLPYRLVGAQRFYGRREVKDILAYLRLISNPDDEISLARVINVPARGIGEKTVSNLRAAAQRKDLSMGGFLLAIGRGSEPVESLQAVGRAQGALKFVGEMLGQWQEKLETHAPVELMDRLINDIDYRGYIDDGTEEGQERWENVMELRRLATEYKEQGLGKFLEDVALVSDQDTLQENANVPTLLTLHAAKGLEFPVVFITGLNDGVLPHTRSFDDPEAMQEERRLFYVGITRAKDRLFLLKPLTRSQYGYSEPAIESRFIEDIPFHLIEEGEEKSRSERLSSRPARTQTWEASAMRTSRAVEQRYQPGAHVLHSVWGEGMVLNSRIQDDDEIVDIYFEKVGLKRVAASLAKLELRKT